MLVYLKLTQFRNHNNLELTINSPITIITGLNSSGKTNILESIFVSSITKSFKVSDMNLVQYSKTFYTINRVDDNVNTQLQFSIKNNKRNKILKINNTKKPLNYLFGKNPITLFEPNDMLLLYTSPRLRREYLDKVLAQVDKNYLYNLVLYKKIIRNRNSLLKQAKKNSINNLEEQIFVYNIALIKPAIYLVLKRKQYVLEILDTLSEYYNLISGESNKITIDYITNTDDENELIKLLEENINIDKAAGFSTIGPHRDDFEIKLNSNVLENSASRGELRSLILALKLCELDYVEKTLQKRPTLLLDDVLSELDEKRQQFLLQNLYKQQTFITTTHLPTKLKLDFLHIKLPVC